MWFVVLQQLMIGPERANKQGRFMKMLNAKFVSWMIVVVLSFGLNGCSTISSTVSSIFSDKVEQLNPNAPYKDPKQKDHWLDNASAWRYWDVSSANNQLVEWVYQENAISLKIDSNNELNYFGQASHTLQVKVIQLTDVSGLKTLLQSADGVRTVLSEPIEMIPNAVFSDSILVAPNQSTTLNFARQQDAKFVAIVSGYAELRPDTSARVMTIPVITIKPPKEDESWLDKLTFGLFADDVETVPDVIRPASVKLHTEFGDKGIELFAAKAY